MVFPNTSSWLHGAVARSAQRWQRLEGEKAWHGIVQEKDAKGEHFWWFHIFLEFSSWKLGENSHFDEHIFELGWNHQLVKDDLLEFLHPWDPQKKLSFTQLKKRPFSTRMWFSFPLIANAAYPDQLISGRIKIFTPHSPNYWDVGLLTLTFRGKFVGCYSDFTFPVNMIPYVVKPFILDHPGAVLWGGLTSCIRASPRGFANQRFEPHPIGVFTYKDTQNLWKIVGTCLPAIR